jgi:hypothetical protein
MSEASLKLQQLLSEKVPGWRAHLDQAGRAGGEVWPVQLSAIEPGWPDHLVKGTLTEIICGAGSVGSAGLIHALVDRAAGENQIIGMIDGADSLDVVALSARALTRLLWVRCGSAAEALKAADLMLRDNNFSLVMLDLKLNPESERRKIPATTWHRLQRLIERTRTVCVVFTPGITVGATRQRMNLTGTLNSYFNP